MKLRTIAILVLVLLLTACARPKPQPAMTPTAPAGATSTAAPAVSSATAIPAVPSSTPISAVATSAPTAQATSATVEPAAPSASPVAPDSTPTMVPVPVPAASPPAQPIVFPAGATNTSIQDQLPPGALHRYALRIQAGQTLVVELPGMLGWAALAVSGADGTVLLSDRVGAVSWSGVVPRTQDYLVDVKSLTGAATSYTLDITIPPIYMPQATVVQFPPGGTSATVQGTLVPGAVDHYVLRVLAGQTLFLASAPGLQGMLALSVAGADGFVLLPESALQASWNGQVPTTQDYYVDVRSIADASFSYALQISVPALATPQPQPQRQRINFPAGGTSATVHGTLAAFSTDSYVLTVLAGQTLNVSVPGLSGQVLLVIWGADGNVLLSDHAIASSFSGVVPTTQDYFIDVRTSTTPVAYTMQVSIPPLATPQPQPQRQRINFPPGGTSATAHGTLAAFSTDSYVLTVLAGQTLNVNVPGLPGKVLLVIWGADGNVLLSDHAIASSYSGVVPTTQDYFIDVRTSSTPVAYTMQVSIPPLSAPEPLPMRITFQAGATSATVNGTLAADASARYVLKAQAGQTLNVEASTTLGQVILIVWGADGTVLLTDHAGSDSFSGPLPSTQDYYIAVRAVGGGPASYSLTVTIPPRSI